MDKKTKRHALRGVEKLEKYQKVFSSPDGEWVLNDMMAAHGMLSSSFQGRASDTIFKEGERNVVLRILTLLRSNPADLRERIKLYEAELGE